MAVAFQFVQHPGSPFSRQFVLFPLFRLITFFLLNGVVTERINHCIACTCMICTSFP